MLKTLKNFIKTKPIIYDYFNSMRPIRDDVDVWLDSYSKANNRKIKFIQVGANDGLRWDPLRRFILRDNWKGVLIEPIMSVYELLKENYSHALQCDLSFLNCVISSGSDFAKIFTYSNEFLKSQTIEDRLYFLQKSSLDRNAVKRSLVEINGSDKDILCCQVPCYTLSSVIEKYFPDNKVDLIFIDAEGHDDEVIRTIDFTKCLPKAIFYESHNLGTRNDDIKSFLESIGYTVTQLEGDAIAEIKK